MAKTTDSTISWFGSQNAEKQMKIGIPGGPGSGEGGLIYLERNTGGTIEAGGWLHTNGTDLLWTAGDTAPADTESGTTLGGITTLDEAYDGGTYIDSSTATGDGNAFSVGGTTANRVEIYHDATDGYIGSRAGDLYLVAVGGDINCSGDNIANAGSITGTTLRDGTANITGGAITSATYDGLTIATSTNTFTLTRGTGSLDVAAGKTVDIDQDVTIAGGAFVTSSACTIDQNLAAAQSPTWVGLTLTGAIATPTNITASGYITTSGDMRVTSDTNRLELGAGASDSYIKFDGTNLLLQDSTSGEFTLAELSAGTPLNPIVTGDFTIADGQFDWVSTSTSAINTWDFGATTVDTFDIVCDNSTAAFLDIEADSFTAHATAAEGLIDINVDAITSGNVIVIDTAQAGTFSGSYLKFYTDGSTDAFTVKGYGATAIAGVAGGTTALTVTKGDIEFKDGSLEVNVDSDLGSYIKRGATGSSSDLMVIETTHNADTGCALHINTARTAGAACSLDIDSTATTQTAGVIDVDAAITTGTVLDINMGTATTSGKGIYVLDNSNDTTARWLLDIYQQNATASHAAVGARIIQKGAGDALFIDKDCNGTALNIDVDAAVASSDAYGIKVDVDNTGGTAGDAYGIFVDDILSSNGTAYAIFTKGTGECSFNADTDDADFTVASATNAEMFAIDAGTDTIGINGLVANYQLGLNVTNNKNMGGIGIIQNDATGDTSALSMQMVGAGHTGTAIAVDHKGTAGGISLSLDMDSVSGTCIDIPAPAFTTGNVFVADDCNALTTGGILKLASNSADTSARNLVSIVQDHASAILANCLSIQQDADSGAYAINIDRNSSDAATVWAVKIDSDNTGGGEGGGIDFSAMGNDEPVIGVSVDTGGIGAIYGRIAVEVVGVGTKYIALYPSN